MTVIVFRDGVMAADTALFRGDFVVSTRVKKIIRTPSGCLVGCSGAWVYGDRFQKWAIDGFPEDKTPPPVEKDDRFGAIVAFPDGRIIEYGSDMLPSSCEMEDYVTDGVAHEFVHALATLGWSAEAIVAHAIKHCVWAGGEVYALRLHAVDEPANEPEPDLEDLVLEPDEPQERMETRAWLTDRGLGGPV